MTVYRFSVGGLFTSPYQTKEVIHYGKTENHPPTGSGVSEKLTQALAAPTQKAAA